MKYYFDHRHEYLNVFTELCTYSTDYMFYSSDKHKSYQCEYPI